MCEGSHSVSTDLKWK